MSGIDIIIIIPIAWGAIKGFKKGIITEIAQIFALILGFMLGAKYSHKLFNQLLEITSLSEQSVKILAFVIVFAIVAISVMLTAYLVTLLVKAIALGWLNKTIGMLLGIFKYALIIGVILFTVIRIDSKEQFIKPETKESSILINPLCYLAEHTIPYLKKIVLNNND